MIFKNGGGDGPKYSTLTIKKIPIGHSRNGTVLEMELEDCDASGADIQLNLEQITALVSELQKFMKANGAPAKVIPLYSGTI